MVKSMKTAPTNTYNYKKTPKSVIKMKYTVNQKASDIVFYFGTNSFEIIWGTS